MEQDGRPVLHMRVGGPGLLTVPFIKLIIYYLNAILNKERRPPLLNLK